MGTLSLPLMGIGNEDLAFLRGRVHLHLITPHGDRKRPGSSELRCNHCRLITPHGDRKRWRGTTAAAGSRRAHYPSWGSETAAPRMWPAPPAPPHYPSWGSETPARHHASRSPAGTHYPSWGSETGPPGTGVPKFDRISLPLMGIGNFGGRLVIGAGAAGLITPHGDRKRHGYPCECASC